MGQRRSSWRLFYVLAPLSLFLNSCLFTYLVKSGTDQLGLLNSRRPIESVLEDPKIDEETKRKLRLALEARQFAENELGFKETKNYTSYVHLDRPYVSWIVSVAEQDRLEYKLFSYPIVGRMPYKGFFKEADAIEEAKKYPPEKYDTWVRGVTAFSTLGWFQDPILSSMLKGDDVDIVELILHESAHATLFIDDAADFNEQLATFLGQEGTRRFFLKREGVNSESLKKMSDEIIDLRTFSKFLTAEMDQLREWYKAQPRPLNAATKTARIKEIQKRFDLQVSKNLKSKRFEFFGKSKLNNAILLGLGTYIEDLDQFEKLLAKYNGNLKEFLNFCATLKRKKNPAQSLQEHLSEVTSMSDSRVEPTSSPVQ